jgi:hypothetical protein
MRGLASASLGYISISRSIVRSCLLERGRWRSPCLPCSARPYACRLPVGAEHGRTYTLLSLAAGFLVPARPAQRGAQQAMDKAIELEQPRL